MLCYTIIYYIILKYIILYYTITYYTIKGGGGYDRLSASHRRVRGDPGDADRWQRDEEAQDRRRLLLLLLVGLLLQ